MCEEAFAFVSCCWCMWLLQCSPILLQHLPVSEQIHSIPAMGRRLGGWVALLALVLGLFGCFTGPALKLPKPNPRSVARWAETAENDNTFSSSYEEHPWVIVCTGSLGCNAAAEWCFLFGWVGVQNSLPDARRLFWYVLVVFAAWGYGISSETVRNNTKHISKEKDISL